MREPLQLLPIGNVQFRNRRVRGKGRRIDEPGVGQILDQPVKKGASQILPPESLQISIPEQSEKHLFFQQWLGWRREPELFRAGERKNFARSRNIRQIEQFEETINRVVRSKL